jgi:initiation factor 1A
MGKRNMQGGNKTKAMAKSTPYERSGTRTPQSEEEKYGIIKSVSGSGRFRVQCADKKAYVGILPGSMRGHKKRNNYVGLDTIVLINDRSSWQTIKENSHADIVYVYTASEQNRLDLMSLFQQEKSKIDNTIIFQFQGGESANSPVINTSALSEEDKIEEEEVDLEFI